MENIIDVDQEITGAFAEKKIEKLVELCKKAIDKNDRVENMTRIKETCQEILDSHDTDMMIVFCEEMGLV